MATQTNTTAPEINSQQNNTSQPVHHDTKFDHNPEQYGTTARPHYAPPQYEETAPRMVTPLQILGDTSAMVDCPFCRHTAMTRVGEEHSGMTWVAGILLGIFCICLACVPCIAHSCQEIDHYCGHCGKQLTHRPYEGQVQLVGVPPAAMFPSQYPMTQQVPSQNQSQQQTPTQVQGSQTAEATQLQESQLSREAEEQRELDAQRAEHMQQPAQQQPVAK